MKNLFYHFRGIFILLLSSYFSLWGQQNEEIVPLSHLDSLYKVNANETNARLYAQALEQQGLWFEAIAPWKTAAKKNKQHLPRLWEALLRCYQLDLLQESLQQKKLSPQLRELASKYENRRATLKQFIEKVKTVEVIDTLVLSPSEAIGYLQHFVPSIRYTPSKASSETEEVISKKFNPQEIVFVSERGDRQLGCSSGKEEGASLTEILLEQGGESNRFQWSFGENYSSLGAPILTSDGYTVIFSAQGKESLGGYDLFLTRKKEDGGFLTPVSLGMPFNSPFNDFLYAVNEELGIGFLLSDRFAPEGNLCIFVLAARDEYPPVPINDLENLRPFALLTPHQTTLDLETDYNPLRKRLKQKLGEDPDKAAQEFFIVISEEVVYRSTRDFRAPQSLALYHRYLEQQQRTHLLEQNLEQWRKDFREADTSVRNRLTPQIQQAEKQLPLLQEEEQETLNQLRSIELRYLNNL
ncbi:MAG: hypothetical protein SPI35_01735 [Porphyromonas sp.]|nr:hypothetical protein [Porphyromonas sp.]